MDLPVNVRWPLRARAAVERKVRKRDESLQGQGLCQAIKHDAFQVLKGLSPQRVPT